MNKSDFRQWLEGEYEPLDEAMTEGLECRSGKNGPSRRPVEASASVEVNAAADEAPVLHKRVHGLYVVVSTLLCAALICFLVYICLDMGKFGASPALKDDELSTFYVEEGLEHTGAPNIVTSIIMEFRGFDTLGESHVLFIAVVTVMMLLYTPQADRAIKRSDAENRHFEPTHDEVLRHGAKLIAPLLVVFAVNILLNGHLSPGGGFSGGAVLGAALILILEAFGPGKTEKYLNYKTLRRLMTCALAFYAISKAYVFSMGANGLSTGIGTGIFGRILSGGLLLPLNLAVGLVVACTMYVIYALLRRKGRL